MHPENKTVQCGEHVEFECRISADCTCLRHKCLKILINQTQVYPENVSPLNENVTGYGAKTSCNETTNEIVGEFWMIVNSRTPEVVPFVSCKALINANQRPVSNRGYITVTDECSDMSITPTTDTPPPNVTLNTTTNSAHNLRYQVTVSILSLLLCLASRV